MSLESKSGQIASSIEEDIYEGKLAPGQNLPTVNEGVVCYGVARKTLVKAYGILMDKGLVESRSRKGYYVLHNRAKAGKRILLLIHSFDPQLQELYREFMAHLGKDYEVDLYFHHYNIQVLEMVINRNIDKYDYYLVSSFNHPRLPGIISRIPRKKVLIVSRNDNISTDYFHITQDFNMGTYTALQAANHLLQKYHEIILCYPGPKGHSRTLKEGFESFCQDKGHAYKVVESLAREEIQAGKAYFVIEDNDMIKVIKCSKHRSWELGRDLGLLAYNETPLKEVIRDGVSVVSSDFAEMAKEMAAFVKKGFPVFKTIAISFIQRNSL